jgi:predicted N-acetyltransferase YhbS
MTQTSPAVQLGRFNPDDTLALSELFLNTFTDSEGPDEGQLICELTKSLITTPGVRIVIARNNEEELTAGAIFSPLKLSIPEKAFLLSPMAVATAYQRQGIGQRLIGYGIDILRAEQTAFIFTYGDPKYYSKTGFKPVSEDMVKAPMKLSYPHGWLLNQTGNKHIRQCKSDCVEALRKQVYW